MELMDKIDNEVTEYIKSHNKYLYDAMFDDELFRPEIYLEIALMIGTQRRYYQLAIYLIEFYKTLTYDYGNTLPYLAWSALEYLCRAQHEVQTAQKNKRLYALKMENNTVKVGIATNVERRLMQIRSATGMNIVDGIYTEIFDDAFNEEQNLHKKYKKSQTHGEYFKIPYAEAKAEIERIAGNHNVETMQV